MPDPGTGPIVAAPSGRLRAGPARDRLVLFCVMLSTAVGTTGLQSVVPAIGRGLGVPDMLIAVAFSLSALLWSVSAPFWARRLWWHGNKRMVVIGLAGFILSMLVGGVSLTLGLRLAVPPELAFAGFIVGRGIYGWLGAAAPPAAQALIVAGASRADRTKAIALLASAFGLGTIIGPAAAPFFVWPAVGLAGPLYVFAAAGIAVLAVVLATLRDTAPPGLRSATPADAAVPRPVRLADRRIRPWIVAGLVSGHAQAVAGQTMAFLVIDRLRLAPLAAQPQIGIVLMSGAGAVLLAQWGIIPRLNPTPRQLVLSGTALTALGCLGLTAAHDLHSIAIAFGVASMGLGFLRPGFTSGASLAVAEDEQGTVAGQITAVNGCAFVLGPAAGIALYEWWHDLPYLTCAGALFAMIPYLATRIPPAPDR